MSPALSYPTFNTYLSLVPDTPKGGGPNHMPDFYIGNLFTLITAKTEKMVLKINLPKLHRLLPRIHVK